jgi:stage III sporulation protein AB
MIRLLGAVLLVTACGSMGLSRSFELRRRVENLTALVSALELMRSEIGQLLTPLPELAERLSEEAPERARPLFTALLAGLPQLGELPFSRLWGDAVNLAGDRLLLRRDERDALRTLGLSLGGSGAQEQEGAIHNCTARLSLYLASARAEAEGRCRLYTALGLSAGLLLAIVLL